VLQVQPHHLAKSHPIQKNIYTSKQPMDGYRLTSFSPKESEEWRRRTFSVDLNFN